MAKPIGLFQKGRTWYLRARVPKDVQPYFITKTVMKSLKTRDYNDALKRKLGHSFSKAILELTQQRLRELEGVVHIPQFNTSTASLSAIPKNRIKMGDLMEKYLSNPRVSRAAGTVKNYRLIGRAIKEVIGNETFVDEVTREQCRVISEILLKLPSNAHKKIKFETLADAVRIGKEKNLPVLSDNTYNTYMHKFHALFDYAVRETYMHQKRFRVKSGRWRVAL